MAGALVALGAYGRENEWLAESDGHVYDARTLFLKNRHQVVYAPLETNSVELSQTNTLVFTVVSKCDLLNMVDIVLQNVPSFDDDDSPSLRRLGIVKKIRAEYGGHAFDTLYSPTQIETNGEIFGRRATYLNGTLIIPLAMAPFHTTDLVRPSMDGGHQLVIIVEFHAPFAELNPTLFAQQYYLQEAYREIPPHEFATVRSQYFSRFKTTMKNGVNAFKLPVIHPCYLIYFWGFDKRKVKRVTLGLDNAIFYSGPIEPLDHVKHVRGVRNVDPTFIYFSQDAFGGPLRSSANFSCIDNVDLTIETDQEDESEFHCVALNIEGVRYCNRMYGMRYSG